jgi:hypothetical protein
MIILKLTSQFGMYSVWEVEKEIEFLVCDTSLLNSAQPYDLLDKGLLYCPHVVTATCFMLLLLHAPRGTASSVHTIPEQWPT